MFGSTTVEVQAKEGDGLLFRTSHRWCLGGVSRDHAEVVREDGGCVRLVGKEVVGDGATIHELKGAIRVFEVQLREPVRGLILCDVSGGALGFTEVVRRRNLDSKVGTTNDSVDMASDSAGGYDGVSTFNNEDVLCFSIVVRISDRGESGRKGIRNTDGQQGSKLLRRS